jgi:hypothetical protein
MMRPVYLALKKELGLRPGLKEHELLKLLL